MSAHSVPLHCPYCAGEDLHPHGERHGAWECRECLRAFSVSLIGQLAPHQPLGTPPPNRPGAASATTTQEGLR
jgi:transposase-like protein